MRCSNCVDCVKILCNENIFVRFLRLFLILSCERMFAITFLYYRKNGV